MKPRTLAACVALVALVAPAQAGAQDTPPAPLSTPSPPPTRAEGVPIFAPILPTLSVTGPTEGEARFDAGLDIVRGLSERWDMSVRPSLGVKSNGGIGHILSIDDSANPSLAPAIVAGLTLSLIRLPGPDDEDARLDLVTQAFDTCWKRCGSSPPPVDAKDFCDAVKTDWRTGVLLGRCDTQPPPQPGGLDADVCSAPAGDPRRSRAASVVAYCDKPRDADRPYCDALAADDKLLASDPLRVTRVDQGALCEAGARMLKDDLDDKADYPEWLISIGGRYSPNLFEYLEPDIRDILSQRQVTRSDILVGLSVVWVSQGGPWSLEAPVMFASTWKPSVERARWCMPVGSVPRGGAGGLDVAESCQEATLYGPTHAVELEGRALLGYTDKTSGLWRAAFGPTVRYDLNAEEGEALEVGIELPVYVRLAEVESAYSGKYKGLLRVVPRLSLVPLDGWKPQGLLTIELLGDRTMFPRALE